MNTPTTLPYKQILLLILDGWGYRQETKYNAIAQAPATYMEYLWQTYPHTLLPASGEAVGLPVGVIGTSEIGHTIIGAGRILDTDLVRISKSIKDNELKDKAAIISLFAHVKKYNSVLHLIGMISPGGVHSHQDHLFALLKIAKDAGIAQVALHLYTDGRDMPPQSADTFLAQLEDVIKNVGVGEIATVGGRYFGMDRDSNWDRIKKWEDAVFSGVGKNYGDKKASEIVQELHVQGTGDEFIEPFIMLNKEGKHDDIRENDSVFFFNFRPDRQREFCSVVEKKVNSLNLCLVTITQLDERIKSLVVFPPEKVETTLANEISKAGLTQVHIAETEKYAHVTYFLNGGDETPHKNEEFVLINSRKDVPTHDLAPHMRTEEIADKTIAFIEKGTNFLAVNFANADMVGHTGKWEPALEAVRFEDAQIKRVTEAMLAKGGVVLITADHGNAELMFDEKTNQPHTAHTLNPVPAILTRKGLPLHNGGLEDVAPTILYLFNLTVPSAMSGKPLEGEYVVTQ